jgi:hypothetical protein
LNAEAAENAEKRGRRRAEKRGRKIVGGVWVEGRYRRTVRKE